MKNTKFIIIHSSDIYRKGLNAVVEGLYFSDSICLSSIHDLSDEHIQFKDQVVLIIKPDLYYKDREYIDSRIKTQSKVFKFAAAFFEDGIEYEEFDEIIYLHDSSEKIFSKLSKVIGGRDENNIDKSSTLSQREKDVLHEVALGYSNKEIADRLFISIHTVITHRKNITEKLGIKSISGLTVYAIMNGIIDTHNINQKDLL